MAREVEDIEALIDAAGGEAYVYGISSGGALALEAAIALPNKVKKLAIYEAPYDSSTAGIEAWKVYWTKLHELTRGRSAGDAVALFMQFVGVPDDMLAGMRQSPMWPALEAVAPTLPYDAAALGVDRTVPTERAATVTAQTLIWMAAPISSSCLSCTRAQKRWRSDPKCPAADASGTAARRRRKGNRADIDDVFQVLAAGLGWQQPQRGAEHTGDNHMTGKLPPTTGDEYIGAFPADVQAIRTRAQDTRAWRRAIESVSYGSPPSTCMANTWCSSRAGSAGFRDPLPAGDSAFQQNTAPYKRIKSTIHLADSTDI